MVVNEGTFEEAVGPRVSKLNGLSISPCVLVVLFLIASCIITFTPPRNYLSEYIDSEVRTQIADDALCIDSLRQVLNKQNLYIMNIQDVFSGKVSADSVQTPDSLTVTRENILMERTKWEKESRHQYEGNEKCSLTFITPQPDVTGLILYYPARGMASDHPNVERRHYSTDIATNPNESVLAIVDRIVVLSTYIAKTSYLTGVQYNQDLVSVYKHCDSFPKREDECAKGREAITLAGNSGTLSIGLHPHFEPWYRSHPINPEKYTVS